MMSKSTQQVVWSNFFYDCPGTVVQVKRLLSQGHNVIVVLGKRVAMTQAYKDGTNPRLAALTLQRELVLQSGIPLPIGENGFPCFAFLAWKSTDAFDAPSEIEVASVVERASPSKELLGHLRAFGQGPFKAVPLNKI